MSFADWDLVTRYYWNSTFPERGRHYLKGNFHIAIVGKHTCLFPLENSFCDLSCIRCDFNPFLIGVVFLSILKVIIAVSFGFPPLLEFIFVFDSGFLVITR